MKPFRNSAVELLALSVCSLFPKAQLVSGEVTDVGFYYDFFFPEPIHSEQLPFIEERMRDFIRQDLPIKIMEMMRKNAIEFFKHQHQELKVALLKENVETLVHICQIGSFYDLGYPPFVESTRHIGTIKLLDITLLNVSLPGRPHLSLTRIEGTAFPDSSSLKQFLKKAESAKQHDHRLLGKEMQLFTTLEETCPGCWSWYPKGALIRQILLDWWSRENRKQKFQSINTPLLIKPQSHLFDKSLKNHHPTIHFESQGPAYMAWFTKAPFHALIFKSKLHSYRDLPIRYCECAEFYDPEREGKLWGLLHARTYTADSGFTFCMPEQVQRELISSLQFIDKTFKMLNFETHWFLIIKNQISKEFSKKWAESRDSLIRALETCAFDYTVDNDEQALFGPVIEIRFSDALGRMWKGPYVYIDLYHPEKFGLHYQGQDDGMHVPAMLGRSIYGSTERLVAVLLEHYAGKMPLWLAPEQVRVIPVSDKNGEYAALVCRRLEEVDLRTSIDFRKENLGTRVYAAESEKIPYMLVVGDKEEKNGTITLRKYKLNEVQEGVILEKFIEQLRVELEAK